MTTLANARQLVWVRDGTEQEAQLEAMRDDSSDPAAEVPPLRLLAAPEARDWPSTREERESRSKVETSRSETILKVVGWLVGQEVG